MEEMVDMLQSCVGAGGRVAREAAALQNDIMLNPAFQKLTLREVEVQAKSGKVGGAGDGAAAA